MAEPSFVYPEHPNFEPYRELAETTELQVLFDAAHEVGMATRDHNVMVGYDRVDVPNELAFQDQNWNLKNMPEWALKPGARANSFWSNSGGINTLSFYKLWRDGYVNEGQRVLRDIHPSVGITPQANEMLTYGVGTLRPAKVASKGLSAALGDGARRVDSELRQQTGVYITDTQVHRDGQWVDAPYALESTNLVMPEVIGELRQLLERRDETDFLDAYLRDMQETTTPMTVPTAYGGGEPLPECLRYMKPRWQEAHRQHLESGMWSQPPSTTGELIDRVEQLLEGIKIDHKPIEIFEAT